MPRGRGACRGATLKYVHTAYIGMGGNLASHVGEPEKTLEAAASRLSELGAVVGKSSLYSTEPVGFADQPRFLNAVIGLRTMLSPLTLLERLLEIEREFGRDRSAGLANGPRTLDLDILLMGDLRIQEAGLEIPHPRLVDRAFVLIPLEEIAGAAIHPNSGKTIQQLKNDLLERSARAVEDVVQVESSIWRAGAGGAAKR